MNHQVFERRLRSRAILGARFFERFKLIGVACRCEKLKPRKKRALELFLRWAVQWVHTQTVYFLFFFSLGDVAILPWPPCIGVMGNSLCSSGILTPNPNELLPHYYTFNEHIRNCVFFSSCFFFSDLSPFLSSFSIPVRERFQFARELHNVLKIIHASLT